MEKYTILCELGRGAFGIVFKAQNKDTKEIVAIKQMIQEYETWEECVNLRELKSLQKLTHNNIVKLREVFRVKKKLSFVFEYVERNIYKLQESAKEEGLTQVPESTIKTIVFQIAQALSYMHKHGFFHRDLKPENLLISPDNSVKLIDFGLAREIRSRPPYTDYVSTRWYRAPEILLRSTNYNSPVDIFALGCIMAELYLLKPLFNGSNEIDQISKITSILGTPSKTDWPDGFILASQKYFTFPFYPPVPLSQVIPGCPPDALNLLSEMLKWDPSKRITASKILSHPYFIDVQLPDTLNYVAEQNIRNQSPPPSDTSKPHQFRMMPATDKRMEQKIHNQPKGFSHVNSSKLDTIFDFMGDNDEKPLGNIEAPSSIRRPIHFQQNSSHHAASMPATKSRVAASDLTDIEQAIMDTHLPPSRVMKSSHHQMSSSMFSGSNSASHIPASYPSSQIDDFSSIFGQQNNTFQHNKIGKEDNSYLGGYIPSSINRQMNQPPAQNNDIYRFDGFQQKSSGGYFPSMLQQQQQQQGSQPQPQNNAFKQNSGIYNFANVPANPINWKLQAPQ